MSAPSPRQTLSYLRQLFESRGIHPKNKLGQNFLIDLNLLDLLLRAAELTKEDFVLEIGSGTGSLTARLADEAGAVLSVEIDDDFYQLAGQLLASRPNVTLRHSDILKGKNYLHPDILAALTEKYAASGCKRLKLVANLPYAVATPVIANLLISELALDRMVVTVQWEIAERLLASPSTKPFGALAVLVQSVADVTLVRRLAPSVFWPRPQVESGIVLIQPNAAKRALIPDVLRFRHFLRDLYTQRRKNLRGALSGLPSGRREKADVDKKLAELGILGTLRSEDLDIAQHQALSEAFKE